MDDETATAKVLEAADRLFYEHGIRSVGMDDVRDASGVSLKRLYRLFPAKEQLAEAALRRRDEAFQRSLAEFAARGATPRERILAAFDYLDEWFAEPDYRGCPFINAFGEMRGSRFVGDAIRDQKGALERFVGELVREAGAPDALTRQLVVLMNGAMVTSAILGSSESARQAKAAAATLLDAAGALDGRAAEEYDEGVSVPTPACPTCGQPASQSLAGPEHGWECRNEACPEFGQAIDPSEPGPPTGREGSDERARPGGP